MPFSPRPRRIPRAAPLLVWLLAAALALPAPLAAQGGADARNALPSLGDATSEDFSLADERRIGERIMRDIRRDPDYLDDPLLLDYVQRMWAELLAVARTRGHLPAELDERFGWEVFLLRDRSVNAFALPGGYSGVHLGLISVADTPDELASVMAHELSHITQRHIARSIGAGKTASLAGLAGMILGVLAASRSPEAANALITGGQAVAVQGQLNFSRDMEREADRVGHGLLVGAGYAPAGMAAMFERLQQAARLNDSQNFPYLRTHPLTSERIGAARARLGVESGTAASRTLYYALLQGRARVLMDPRDVSLQRLQDFDSEAAQRSAASPPERLAGLYASAMASLLRRDPARAEAALAAARPLVAGDAAATEALDLLALDVALARGDTARATALADALARSARGDTRPVLLARARAALAPGAGAEPLRAISERLQTWVTLYPRDALAWGSLAQLWERGGQRLRAVRAEAESRAALGDLQGAIDRLRAGQRLGREAGTAQGGDFVEASVIEARLRVLEEQRRAQLTEERG